MSKPPIGTQPRTRNAKSKGDFSYIFTNRSKSEILATNGSHTLKDLPGAHHLLTQFGLKVPSNGITLNAISAALFEFTTMAHADILKALFVALDNAIQTREQEKGPQTLSHALSEKMEELIARQESQAEKLTRISDEIKTSIDLSTDALEKATEQACTALKELPPPPAIPPPPRPTIYADALKYGTPALHAEVLAQSEAETRQVTIKCETNDLYNLSEQELVLKANIVIENIAEEEDASPPGTRFLSARKKKGMKICLELNAQESGEWLSKKPNQQAFLQHFGVNASLVPKTYKAVVEFVPVTLNADLPASIRGIEEASGLDSDDLTTVNWIKPPKFRKPNQRVTHTIVSFAS